MHEPSVILPDSPDAPDGVSAVPRGGAAQDSAGRGGSLASVAIIAAVVLGVGLRLKHYAAAGPYWHDEASLVVNIFEKTAADLLGPLESAQAAAPGFLVAQRAMHVWLGRSELAMRLLPLLVALAGLAVFALLARRTVPPWVAALLTLMYACSERLVWHAAEAKQYSIDIFVALLILWVALDATRRSPTGRLLVCAAVAAVSIWFSHATAFMFGGISLALLPALLRGGRRGAVTWVACNALFAASFLALYLTSIRNQQVSLLYDYWAQGFVDFARPWRIPTWFVFGLVSTCNYALDLGGPVLMPLAALGGYVLGTTGRKQMLAILTMPAALVLVAAALRQYPFGGSRLTLFLTPCAFLLAGVGLAAIVNWAGERAGRAWVAIAVSAYLVAVAAWAGGTYGFRPPVRGNMAGPVRYIADHARPGDVVYANKVSEYRCYAQPGVRVRDAEELREGRLPAGRFWLAITAIPSKKDRRSESLVAVARSGAEELDTFIKPGASARLFESRVTFTTQPAAATTNATAAP